MSCPHSTRYDASAAMCSLCRGATPTRIAHDAILQRPIPVHGHGRVYAKRSGMTRKRPTPAP